MPSAIRPIGHEDRLSLVDHLDELRTRLMISAAVLGIVFGLCLWQNHELLHIINKPLQAQTRKQVAKGQGTVGQAVLAQQGVLKVAHDTQAALGLLAAPRSGLSAATRAQLSPLLGTLGADVQKIPRNPPGDNPVTLGVGEPFTTTLTVALYFAVVISAPLILYVLYGFVLPALRPAERRIAFPLLTAVPFLFAAGVLFGYFVVLPAAVRFFVNFNSGEFNVLVQASQFYKFAATVLLAMGLVFQVPVVILGVTRVGLVTPGQLRRHRRYAIVACATIAAFLPGDVITLVLETVPLYLLYEASILVASFVGRAQEADTAEPVDSAARASTAGADATTPTVQQMIDHTDADLSGLMLFDLRGRGRRRTVQVTYIVLAVIFALGFVGLGVGGGFGSGGIFSAFTGNEGSGGTSHSGEIKKYEQLARRQPNSVQVWEKLLLAQLHEAGGEAYVTRGGGVTSKGKELYAQIANSWRHYTALAATPSVPLAKEVLVVFGEEGLNEPAAAVQVLQIIVAAEPHSTHYYSFLADYAYKAKNTRVGDLAAAKAVAVASPEQRARVKTELEALKKNPTGTPEAATGTTNGQTFTVKSGGSGTYTGTAPVPTTTSGKKK